MVFVKSIEPEVVYNIQPKTS